MSVSVWAQDEGGDEAAGDGGGGGKNSSQVNVFMGRVLPNGVTDEDDIFGLYGGRFSMPMGKGPSYYEFGFLYGNNSGVNWRGLFGSVRMDVPIETLVGIVYGGMDYSQFEGPGASGNTIGFHVGGGMSMLIGGNAHVRMDMKVNSDPGTSLFFGMGLVFDLVSSEGGGAGGE